MEVTGILVKKTSERDGVSSRNGMPWKIAEYLIEIPGQFPRHINFRVTDGQVGRLARFDSLVGKTVTVSFDIDAHEYQGRWFNELNAWGIIEYVDSTTRQANIAAAQAAQQPAAEAAGTETKIPAPQADGKGDDLPF